MLRILWLAGIIGIALISAPTYADDGKYAHNFRSESLFDPSDKERWIIRARALLFEPSDASNVSSIGGSADIDEQYAPEIDVTYFLTESWGLELSLSTPPLDVNVQNTALGQLEPGNVWLLTPTLMLQHHFMPQSKGIRPYLGAGINYTHFFNEGGDVGNNIDYEDSIGFALQAGFDYEITEHWALNLEVKKMMVDTEARIQNGATSVNADVDIDPWVFGIGVSYRF